MRRVLFLLILTIALAVPMAPAQAHDTSTPFSCTGEEQVAFHVTAAGNLYEMTSVTCVGRYAAFSDHWVVEGISRDRCYRNARPWDGCRAVGNIQLQLKAEAPGSSWVVQTSSSYAGPGASWPCSGEACWFSDSTRFESPHGDETDFAVARGKNAGTAIRFLLADGSNVYTEEVAHQWSGTCVCFN